MAEDRILIAGAGPVGMVAALKLAGSGVPVTVMERAPDLPEDLRASTFHPPTLDLLDELGLAADLVPMGLKAGVTQYRDRREGLIAEFDIGMLRNETAHPFRLQCEQFKFTRLIRDRLAATPGVDLRFATEVMGVAQDADGVTVTVERDGVPDRLRGAYLLGADGAWSAVRRTLDIPFEGLTYPERFLVVSTPYPFEQAFENLSYVNYVSDPEEWCVLLRVPGLWRVLFPTPPEEPNELVLGDETIERRLQALHSQRAPYEIRHRTLYQVHQRVATRYRHGRALLAGDAAHINNPLGGMGMNGGIHDALNLAEKLIEIHRGGGRADADALLDRYERQRRPIAIEYVNANTARNKKMMEEKDPVVRAQNLEEIRRTATDPDLAYAFLLKSTMIESLRRAAAIV